MIKVVSFTDQTSPRVLNARRRFVVSCQWAGTAHSWQGEGGGRASHWWSCIYSACASLRLSAAGKRWTMRKKDRRTRTVILWYGVTHGSTEYCLVHSSWRHMPISVAITPPRSTQNGTDSSRKRHVNAQNFVNNLPLDVPSCVPAPWPLFVVCPPVPVPVPPPTPPFSPPKEISPEMMRKQLKTMRDEREKEQKKKITTSNETGPRSRPCPWPRSSSRRR